MIQAGRVHTKRLAEVAERLYEETLKNKLEPRHTGKIVVIDAESGDYYLGNSLHEANQKARKKHPDNVFFAVKVGYPAVYSFSSRVPVSSHV